MPHLLILLRHLHWRYLLREGQLAGHLTEHRSMKVLFLWSNMIVDEKILTAAQMTTTFNVLVRIAGEKSIGRHHSIINASVASRH